MKVIERGREIKQEGIIIHLVHVEVLLEGGDEHPEEGKGQQDREHQQHQHVHHASADFSPAHAHGHATSARWAMRSMK
jgi:hypothetical protein